MDKGQLTGAVFIDLTKTFDMVNHSILLFKLCSLGDPNTSPAYNWFEPYHSNRCQMTVCNGTKSSPETPHLKHLKLFKLVYPKAPFWVPYRLRFTSTTYQITWNTVT